MFGSLKHGERGSIMPMTALLVVVVLGFTAFAVDLGLSRVAARDMQAVADAVALDTARSPALTSCDTTTLTQKAKESLARQNRRIGRERPLVVTPGRVDATGQFTAADASCNAVRITASTEVDYAFAPVIGTDSGQASRSAVGTAAEPSMCFSVGTSLLALNTSDGALSPLLDHILKVNLRAVGYDGIASLKETSVPLISIIDLLDLDVGTVNELLASEVSLGDFIIAAVGALEANGDTASASLLRAISIGVSSANLTLGEILNLGTATSTEGLSAGVNLLEILTAAIVAANGQNAVGVTAPGLTSVTIIEPPVIACGRSGATAKSAQIRLRLADNLRRVNLLGLVGGRLELGIDVGQGTAELKSIACSNAGPAAQLKITSAGASVLGPIPPAFGQVGLTVTTASFISAVPLIGRVLAGLIGLLVDDIKLDVLVAGTVAGTEETRTLTFTDGSTSVPPIVVPQSGNASVLKINALDVKLSSGQGGLVGLLTEWLNLDDLLSALLGGLVTPIVNQVVDPLVSSLLGPVLNLLGLKLGVSEVQASDPPNCSGVRLAG